MKQRHFIPNDSRNLCYYLKITSRFSGCIVCNLRYYLNISSRLPERVSLVNRLSVIVISVISVKRLNVETRIEDVMGEALKWMMYKGLEKRNLV